MAALVLLILVVLAVVAFFASLLLIPAEGATSCCSSGVCAEQSHHQKPDTPGCDQTLANHLYHPARFQVHNPCMIVTGTFIDATRGKQKDGCRHEADGDGHCFLILDPGQQALLNQKNIDNELGALVFEPMCRYKVKQEDAKAACKNFKQDFKLPPIGSHVKIIGVYVTDLEHGHRELHPISSIEIIK